MATFTAVEQRAYIKIEYYRDTKRVKILNTLKSVCGKDALPKTTVYRWTDEFRGAKHGCTQILKFGEVSKIWNQSVVLNLRSRFILGLHIT